MEKVLKDVVSGVMDLKLDSIVKSQEVEELCNSEKYRNINNKLSKVLSTLKSKISQDVYELICEIMDLEERRTLLYEDYYFKKGIIAGFTDLKFLGQIKDITYMGGFIDEEK
ncbi:hypothetical protein [Clostridium tyrobutyricum]|uniref:hypothetical protein n=1 Tax=Clostridium tyrobutyricum TaxID=1519 RepID=UPI001C38A4C8|nr:hypothetical protein [Clostridium tyrobutyricum]MBV4439323.1 hypothetical protein [Clostridium tyrobutyricum]